MFLTFRNIVHYLLDAGLINKQEIFSDQLKIKPVESRNNSFMILRKNAPSYFLKQVKALDSARTSTLKTEADCYWLTQNHPAFSAIADHIPTYINYDYTNHILVTECLTDTVNLAEFYSAAAHLPLEVAARQAQTLAACHRQTQSIRADTRIKKLFSAHPPSVFGLDARSIEYWNEKDKAGEQMVKLIRGNRKFLELLQNAGRDWQPTTLIHGDIKHANFLIKETNGAFRTYLIDWEIASFGDPCWDVAGILQNYFLYWIDRETKAQQDAYQGFSLEEIQPSLQTFWETYRRAMEYAEAEADRKLEKALRFAGLKLIQTCGESVRNQPYMPTSSAMMLQLSMNILANPADTLRRLILQNETVA